MTAAPSETPARNDSRARHLPPLDGLRAIAALLVFNVHAAGYCLVTFYGLTETAAGPYAGASFESLLLWLHRAWYGVDLFFVLSGFLMARQFAFASARPGTFLRRRAARILPAYLAALVLAAIAQHILMNARFDVHEWLANLAFLPGFFELGIRAILPVAWSMSYEVGFYLAVPLLALAYMRLQKPWLAHVALACIALALGFLGQSEFAMFHAYSVLFVVGIVFAYTPQLERVAPALALPGLLLWIGFTVLVKLHLLNNREWLYYPASALACGGCFVAALAAPKYLPWFPGAQLQWIGERSYSLFLTHSIVIYLLGAASKDLLRPLGAAPASLLLIAASLLLSLFVAAVLYRYAERPWFKPSS